ncbi:uncharacterized protein LOC131066847 isoform X2 [Cryptomeria japonica]|uniref:uncharacterized protein LOC131066847 isoform X2 n=1 Tax=Cryptomeria japonica TaxID=3369 RepID=UPI0027DA9EFC|nr:uncharacterized protein LOC131066847 isoform X2 [Cryptomeria japonica]
MGEDIDPAGGRKGSGESLTSKRPGKSKVVEDILETVKRENLGFSEKQLRPAVNSLIEATGGSSSPLRSGEYAHRRHHNDQIPVKHSGNATESGLAQLVRDVADQGRLHSITPLRSNDTQKKHSRGEFSTDGSSKAKKMKLNSNCPGSKPTEHIKKNLLEQNDPISPFSAAQGEMNVSPLRMNKLHPDTFPSAPCSGRKEHYIPKKVTQAGQLHGSVGPLNGNTSTDTRTSYVARADDLKMKTSKSYSNASPSKNHDGIDFKPSVVPRVKEKESSRHRSVHKNSASAKQVHPNLMCEKHLTAMNIAGVDEGCKLGSPKLRSYSERQIGELKMDSKECREGKIGYHNEPQKDYKRNSSGKQISLTEELNKTFKGHCMRKVKDHNESVLSVTERVSFKQKSGNSEGDSIKRAILIDHVDVEQNKCIKCKNVHEENKTRSRDNRKPSNDKESMPSKEFTSPLKKQHNRKLEGPNKEVILPYRKFNNVVPYYCSNKPNSKNAVISEKLSLEETRDIQDDLTIQDTLHGPKELTKERVSGQFSYSFLQELKIAASGWVKSGNGWLKTDMSFEALQFFFEWKKNLDLRKKKALALSNDNRKDNCLNEQGTTKTGEAAQVGRKKTASLSENEDVDGNLLSWDISRGLEKKKISCVNEYDDTFFPDDFVYITKCLITADAHVDLTLSRIGDMHCSCSGNCLLSTMPCKCTDDTRGEYAYDRDGLLIPRLATNFCFEEGKMTRADFITECTPICPCDMQCGNRVVQRGLKYRLQVFMTKEGKGWGVRTLDKIMARSFLFEYIGEIMTNMEQYYRNEEYKDKKIHTYQMLLDADHDMETRHFKDGLNDNEALTLDATRLGNVSRFVNHRCGDTNMFIRPVQIETRDTHYYHVAFFAAHDISQMEELTWDYGINFEDKHEVKGFRCLCGSSLCRDSKRKVTRKG